MGEGDRDSTGEALSRRPWPEPETGHSPVAAGLRGSRSRAEHKAPAGQRVALLSTRAHPPPDGRRSPELVPGGGRRSGVAHRAEPSAPRASTPATPAVAFVVRPNYADPAPPGQKFGAPPLSGTRTRSGAGPARSPVPEVPRPPPHLSPGSAPRGGSARPGPTPLPRNAPAPWGRGQPPWAPGPSEGEAGARPRPQHPLEPGQQCHRPAGRDPRTPTLAASERARGGERLVSPRSRPGAPPLTCQLSSQ